MPNQNISKVNITDNYYHVYTLDNSDQQIFLEESDYWFFFSIVEKFLSKVDPPNQLSNINHNQNGLVEVLVYCMMPNHFHLILYHNNLGAIKKLMNGILKSYGRYFNEKYNNKSQLFSSSFIISRILTDECLLNISRHVHLNPVNWIDYPYSSLRAYLYDDAPCWINKKRISKLYGSTFEYFTFLKDNQSKKVNTR